MASAIVALGVVASACSPTRVGTRSATPIAGATGPPALYVAVGAGESRGEGTDNPLREAWPQVLFRKLPQNYSLVNLSGQSSTTADAVDVQLPQALALHPALVTIWLNVNDLLARVPPDRYQADLSKLVHDLRSGGATVLLANTPPLDQLPAVRACQEATVRHGTCPPFLPQPVLPPSGLVAAVTAYNAAIAAVATREGATLVDLHAGAVAAQAQGSATSLVGADGFHPNAAGAEAVAAQFDAAWRHRPGFPTVVPPSVSGG